MLFQCAPHLEPEAQIHPHVHCVSCRRASRSITPAGSISPALLSPHSRAPDGVSRQFVDALKWPFSEPAASFRGSAATCATKLRAAGCDPCFAKTGWSFQATLRGPSMCSSISVATPHRVAIPIIDWSRWPPASHLSLARLRSHNEQKLMTLALDEFLRVSCCLYFPKGLSYPPLRLSANRRLHPTAG